MFRDRQDAGRQLAAALGSVDPGQTVIIALPRGGVPVAAEIARESGAPLDLVQVRKIGAPGQPELAAGAVVDGDEPQIVVNDEVAGYFRLSEADIERLAQRELPEIERRRKLYLGERQSIPIEGRTVIVVDDGIATGASIRVALRALRRRHPARLILAVPVASPDILARLAADADEIVCVSRPEPFIAVGHHYRDFAQVSDDEVIRLLQGKSDEKK